MAAESSIDRAKDALGINSDNELALFLGVTHGSVGGYRRRSNDLPLAQCLKVVEETGVSLDWLILGKGEAAAATADTDPDARFVPLYNVPVSAGHGSFFEAENIIQQVPFDSRWLRREGLHAKDLVCLPIAGDSMAPGLKSGDIVLVNRARVQGDGVFVLRLSGALRIKRLQWLSDGRLRISSDNPIYETEYVTPEDLADDFAIIGGCHTKIGRVD